MGKTGIQPPTLWLVDDPLYVLSPSHRNNQPWNQWIQTKQLVQQIERSGFTYNHLYPSRCTNLINTDTEAQCFITIFNTISHWLNSNLKHGSSTQFFFYLGSLWSMFIYYQHPKDETTPLDRVLGDFLKLKCNMTVLSAFGIRCEWPSHHRRPGRWIWPPLRLKVWLVFTLLVFYQELYSALGKCIAGGHSHLIPIIIFAQRQGFRFLLYTTHVRTQTLLCEMYLRCHDKLVSEPRVGLYCLTIQIASAPMRLFPHYYARLFANITALLLTRRVIYKINEALKFPQY